MFVLPIAIAPALRSAFDEQRVLVGNEIAIDRRPERRADAARRLQILVRDRQPVQRTESVAAGLRLVGGGGVLHRAVGDERHDRVDARVDVGDPLQVGADNVTCGKIARPNAPRELHG